MVDVDQILPQLWVGGAITSDADVEWLLHLGITANLNLRVDSGDVSPETTHYHDLLPPAPPSLVFGTEIQYLNNPSADDGTPKPVAWFRDSWDFAEPVFRTDGVLLVNCSNGEHRSPSVAFFLLRGYFQMDADAALGLLEERRPIADPAYRDDAEEALVALGLS